MYVKENKFYSNKDYVNNMDIKQNIIAQDT